ncbi:MAG: hypothetical protein ABI550_00570, partial [Ignavibacteriaceae bacterium]
MISYAKDVFIIILLFFLFGASHSILASKKIKQILIKKLGNLIAFYRAAYNIFSLFFLYFLFEILPQPDIVIYDLPNPFDIAILIPQFLSLAGFFWTLKYFCVKEFLGINQIKRYFNNTYDIQQLDEQNTLNIAGPYKFSR